MKILACDTSSSVCAVGVFENDKLILKEPAERGSDLILEIDIDMELKNLT